MNDMTTPGALIALPQGPDLEKLFRTQGGLDGIVADIAARCRSEVFDCTTAAGRKGARSLAYKVAQSKTMIDDAAKTLNADMSAAIAQVNGEKRKAVSALEALQDDIKRPAVEWEAHEEARKKRHMDALQAIASPGVGSKSPTVLIRTRLAELTALVIDESWQEFQDAAQTRRDDEVERLGAFLEVAEARDEAERLRQEREAREAAEWAARREQDRLDREAAQKKALEDQAAREAAEAEAQRLREEAAARDDELAAMRAKLEAAEREKAESEARAKAQAELQAAAKEAEAMRLEDERKAAEAKAEADRIATEKAEIQRLADEQAKATLEAEAQAHAEAILRRVRDEVRAAFAQMASAKGLIHYEKVVDAIFDGQIPYLVIS